MTLAAYSHYATAATGAPAVNLDALSNWPLRDLDRPLTLVGRSVASFLATPWEGHQAFAVHVAKLGHRPPSTPAFILSVPCWS